MRLEQKHKLAARWTHWVNFPALFIMIWSGLMIYWANDVYRVGAGSWTLFRFFPDWFYNALHLPHRLAEGMAIHFVVAWFFVLNGLAYCCFLAISGEWRSLVPARADWREAVTVFLADLRLAKSPARHSKYNAAQRIAYSAIVLMGAGSTLTGLAIYKPAQLSWLTALFGGYVMARWIHFLLTLCFVLFFVVHVAQVVRAGWTNFAAMVSGVGLAPETSEKEESHA